MIQHHVEACKKVSNLSEVLIVGSYNSVDIQPFADEMSKKCGLAIRYLQEYTPLGTAGALYHFRDQLRAGGSEHFFVFNGDVCADFPLDELLQYHKKNRALFTIMATEATRQQSLNYGCLVTDNDGLVAHYVEKPSTFVSTIINCGTYVASIEIFQTMSDFLYSDRLIDKQTYGFIQTDYL